MGNPSELRGAFECDEAENAQLDITIDSCSDEESSWHGFTRLWSSAESETTP